MPNENQKQWHPRPGFEALIHSKGKRLVAAEKEFWKVRRSIERKNCRALETLGVATPLDSSTMLSSLIWGLRDGAVFIRHVDKEKPGTVEFKVDNCTIQQWKATKYIVPYEGKLISLAPGASGIGTLTMYNSSFNKFAFEYLSVSSLQYDDGGLPASVTDAVMDFYLTLLGMQLLEPSSSAASDSHAYTLNRLTAIADEFEALLHSAENEETLQVYLKQHPYVLDQNAQLIPKQRLGEDFVTDFVLIEATANGPTYWMIEIEKATHPILTKNGCLSSSTTQAIKQTREWDVWMEKNKAYLQNRLPGFESPRFAVVIGRSSLLSDNEKALIRSYNRSFLNLVLWSYDDVLTRLRTSIEGMRRALNPGGV